MEGISLESLREQVRQAYMDSTRKELITTLSKNSKSFDALRDEIYLKTKKYLAQGTLLNFFDPKIVGHHDRTIKIILQYIEDVKKTVNLNKLIVVRDKQPESIKEQSFNKILFDPKKYSILILPFYNPEEYPVETLAGFELKRRLLENVDLVKNGLEIEYLIYSTFDNTSKMAEDIGKQIPNTNMVIWGIDSKPRDLSHQVYFHYLDPNNESKEFIKSPGKTKKLEILRLVELSEGEVKLEIENVIFWFLANKFYLEGDDKKAIENINKIANEVYFNENIHILAGDCYYNLKDFNKSEELYRTGLELNPNNFWGNLKYGNLILFQRKDYVTALSYYQRCIEVRPDYYKGYFYAALVLEELKKYRDAETYYLKTINLNPRDIIHYYFGKLLERDLEKNEEAKMHYEKAVEMSPNNPEFHECYASFLWTKLKNFKEAKIHYEKALEINPNSAKFNINYAAMLGAENDFEKAKQHYDKAQEIEPDTWYVYWAYSYFYEKRLKDRKIAKKYYNKAAKLNPELRKKSFNEEFNIK